MPLCNSERPWNMTVSMVALLGFTGFMGGMIGCGPRPRTAGAPVASLSSASRPPALATRATGTIAQPIAQPNAASLPSADASPAPIAGSFYAHVHAPGAAPKVHVNVSLTEWTLTGCISEVPGACDKSGAFVVGPAGRTELLRIWKEVRATPRCEPEARVPGDRFFEITHGDETFAGRVPANEAELATRNDGPCRAGARLAMWFVHQFRDRPE